MTLAKCLRLLLQYCLNLLNGYTIGFAPNKTYGSKLARMTLKRRQLIAPPFDFIVFMNGGCNTSILPHVYIEIRQTTTIAYGNIQAPLSKKPVSTFNVTLFVLRLLHNNGGFEQKETITNVAPTKYTVLPHPLSTIK